MAGSPLDPYADRYAQRTHGMRASEIRALFSVANRPEVVSLAGGMPFVSALPLDAVGEMVGDLVARRGASILQYSGGQGDERLREQITTVMALEGIEAAADDVVVTVGSQQALDLVARVFLDPGDVVLAEAPSYVGALGTFQSAQAQVVHVEMDDEGLIPQALEETLSRLMREKRRPKLLYTVPNYHNPAGVTLTEPRRDQMLEIAARYGVLVLEDNPYGLLGFDEEPRRALRARTEDGVVYLGTFSKTFAPGLRVGWVLAPHTIREKLVLATEAQILCPPTTSCAIVSAYLETQPWQEQIKVFRELYRERRDATISSLEQLMPADCTWTNPTGGFYVWVTVPGQLDTKAMLPRAVHARVAYVPGVGFYADGQGSQHLRLSYCYPEPERIREGVRRLAGVVGDELSVHQMFGSASRTSQVRRGSADTPSPDLA